MPHAGYRLHYIRAFVSEFVYDCSSSDLEKRTDLLHPIICQPVRLSLPSDSNRIESDHDYRAHRHTQDKSLTIINTQNPDPIKLRPKFIIRIFQPIRHLKTLTFFKPGRSRGFVSMNPQPQIHMRSKV